MPRTVIERHDRNDGQTRWNVYLDSRWIGQFYTRERAAAFVQGEVARSLILEAR